LEEPPYYATEKMGSYVHANSLQKHNVDVYGMISLEMIGFFRDTKNSQTYPLGVLKLIYGNRGDYITLVRKVNKGKFVRKFCRFFGRSKLIKTKKFTAPRSLTGIDFSDHRSYWGVKMDAMMITDTAFYRNENYHQETDTIDTIDFKRMARVIDALIFSIEHLK